MERGIRKREHETEKRDLLDRVHGNTSNLGPAVTFGFVLEVRATGLQHGLVDTATAGNDADGATAGGGHNLLGAGRQTEAGDLLIRVVGHNGGVVTRAAGEDTTVTGLSLDVANNGT